MMMMTWPSPPVSCQVAPQPPRFPAEEIAMSTACHPRVTSGDPDRRSSNVMRSCYSWTGGKADEGSPGVSSQVGCGAIVDGQHHEARGGVAPLSVFRGRSRRRMRGAGVLPLRLQARPSILRGVCQCANGSGFADLAAGIQMFVPSASPLGS